MQFVWPQKGKWFISSLCVWGLIKNKNVSELNLKRLQKTSCLFQPIRWLVSEERSCCVTNSSLRVQVKPQWFGESCGAAEASTAARSPDTPDTWTLNTVRFIADSLQVQFNDRQLQSSSATSFSPEAAAGFSFTSCCRVMLCVCV